MDQNCCDCAGKARNCPSHIGELPRLNRISGQLDGIKKMIEDHRYCPEILIQLRAVRKALLSVETNILQAHLRSCVVQSFASETERDRKISELADLFKRFES